MIGRARLEDAALLDQDLVARRLEDELVMPWLAVGQAEDDRIGAAQSHRHEARIDMESQCHHAPGRFACEVIKAIAANQPGKGINERQLPLQRIAMHIDEAAMDRA